MKKFRSLVIGLGMGLLVTANASANPILEEGPDRGFDINPSFGKFAAEGVLQCANSDHTTAASCHLRLIRLDDQEIFAIDANESLKKLHCNDHRDVKVTVSGHYTLRSAFGRDRINVASASAAHKLDDGEIRALLKVTDRGRVGFGFDSPSIDRI